MSLIRKISYFRIRCALKKMAHKEGLLLDKEHTLVRTHQSSVALIRTHVTRGRMNVPPDADHAVQIAVENLPTHRFL